MTSLICWVLLDDFSRMIFLCLGFMRQSVDFHPYLMSNDVNLEETGGGNTKE